MVRVFSVWVECIFLGCFPWSQVFGLISHLCQESIFLVVVAGSDTNNLTIKNGSFKAGDHARGKRSEAEEGPTSPPPEGGGAGEAGGYTRMRKQG